MFIQAGALDRLWENLNASGFYSVIPRHSLKNVQCVFVSQCDCSGSAGNQCLKKKTILICIIKMHLKNTGIKYQTIIHFRAMNI